MGSDPINDRQVFVDNNTRSASELEQRQAHLEAHPPLTGLVVPDNLRTMSLTRRPWRNNAGEMFHLAGNRILQAHLSEIPPHGATTRHRHTTEAYIYIVKGSGYSLINYEGEDIVKVDWEEGMIFSPPLWAWHQHFNSDGNDSARYLAVQDTGLLRSVGLHNVERHEKQFEFGESY